MSGPFGAGALQFFGGADDFYSHNINQSLRFEDGDSAYLYKTYGSSAGGNTSTWTFSVWLKIGDPNAQKVIWAGSASSYSTNLFYMQLRGDSQSNRLDITWRQNSSTTRSMSTNRQFRDTGSWMHIVLACDTTQATASNRLRLYINGTEETSFSTDNRSTISQSSALPINANSYDHAIGRSSYSASAYFDGYMAEINFVDGSQLAPTSFGETKAGIWIPKNYTGSHGTTGFYLPFDDSSALGDDESANTNDWTSSGLAATDVVLDSPTNNWATMNPLDGNGPDMQEGNLKPFGDTASSVFEGFKGTFPMSSGKWYWEVNAADVNNIMQIGITPTTATGVGSSTNLSYHTDAMIYNSGGTKAIGTGGNGISPSSKTTSSYGNSYTDGDIIGVALDLDSSTTTLTFYKNNSSEGTAFSSLASDEYVALFTGIDSSFGIFNFGQDSSFAGTKTAQGNTDGNGKGDFYYTPPSGYLACCTANLPDPAIDPAEDEEPADNFNTVLYTGNSGTQNVTGVGFQPDWVWIKPRTTSSGITINNVVHTSTFDNAYNYLITNRSDIGENTNANFDWFKSFDSDGFTVAYSSSNGTNSSNWNGSFNYVAWNWLAGGSASSNDQGDITASVSANTEAGFSIVTFASSGSSATVGHGLNSPPELIISKNRDTGSAWSVYAAPIGNNKRLRLDDTDAQVTSGVWGNTTPTSTVFTQNLTVTTTDLVCYCFHSVDGYSRVGSYTGNGSSDGAFVYTGFRPAFIIYKETGNANNWILLDNKRDPDNVVGGFLYPNLSNAEATGYTILDFLSNGFKHRSTATSGNRSGGSYVYIAFAEQPFKYSNAR